MPTDLEIAQNANIKNISEIASSIGLNPDEYECYGRYKAKITMEGIGRVQKNRSGKYILVTAINPTPLGEGKTVTTIGTGMALSATGAKSSVAIRQPSLGPVFGIKGGAAGGGYSQVVPMEDLNLHFTGDVHAVGAAHNLLSAFLDNHIHHTNSLNIEQTSITWPHVMDISDRSMRHIVQGLGGKSNGTPRESSFDITVASEVMAILALAENYHDLRSRLGKIIVAYNKNKEPITAEDLKVAGSMAALLKDAIKPNLIQTLENTPCLVHAGPFANIAHGNSSILADKFGIKVSDFLVTEAGFGADCGAEKFMDIKCRVSGMVPDAVLLVASIRALKMHGNAGKVTAGKPLPIEITGENLPALIQGSENLIKHIENLKLFGVPIIVTLNRFTDDRDNEIETVKKLALDAGADGFATSNVWAEGSKGGKEIADEILRVTQTKPNFKFLYELSDPLIDKIEAIAKKIYGAGKVEFSTEAKKKLKLYTSLGFDKLPVCMAKTPLSLSHDPKLKGRPQGFTLPIGDIKLSAGAGFIYPLCGDIRTMPGLPSQPAGNFIDLSDNGVISGLY